MLHFNIRFIQPGQRYGLNDALTNDSDERMIEFYDPRFPHTPLGQFVSRYYVSTLMADRHELMTGGLCLDGGIPDWSVSSHQMCEIFRVIAEAESA